MRLPAESVSEVTSPLSPDWDQPIVSVLPDVEVTTSHDTVGVTSALPGHSPCPGLSAP